MGYFYRGRHRAPSPTGTRLAAAAVTGAASLPLLAPYAHAAPPGDLGVIAACESSGNPQASNGSHFGLFQFDLGTWASVGGTGNPAQASVSEQVTRAGLLLSSRGTQPWAASQHCWGGAHPPAPIDFGALGGRAPAVHVATKAADTAPVKAPAGVTAKVTAKAGATVKAEKPSWAAAAARYTVRSGDTLSGIDPAHWRQVWAANRAVIGDNPDLIFPGQQLAL